MEQRPQHLLGQCEVCEESPQDGVVFCLQCKAFFCFFDDHQGKNHFKDHVQWAGHTEFIFPGAGQLACWACKMEDVTELYSDTTGTIFCQIHATRDSSPFLSLPGLILKNISEMLCAEIPPIEPKPQTHQAKEPITTQPEVNLEAPPQPNAIPFKKPPEAEAGFVELPVREDDQQPEYVRLPKSFPVAGKELLTINGRTLVEEFFAKDIVTGELTLEEGQWRTDNDVIMNDILRINEEIHNYSKLMGSAYEIEFQERNEAEPIELENAELITTNLGADSGVMLLRGELEQPSGYLKEGQPICIETGDLTAYGHVVENSELVLVMFSGGIPNVWLKSLPPSVLLRPVVMRAPSEIEAALSFLVNLEEHNSTIKCLLGNNLIPNNQFREELFNNIRFKLDVVLKTITTGHPSSEDASQQEAVKFAFGNSISIILGCAGSGKTYVSALISFVLAKTPNAGKILLCLSNIDVAKNIAHFIEQLGLAAIVVCDRGEEISTGVNVNITANEFSLHEIVTEKIAKHSYSNDDVNWEEMKELIELVQNCSRSSDEIKPRYSLADFYGELVKDTALLSSYDRIETLELKQADVIICECKNAADQRIGKQQFSAVIIDDATTLLEQECALAIARAPNHIVLLGDKSEISPNIVNVQMEKAKLQRSIVHRLLDLKFPSIELAFEYRSHGGLFELANNLFYHSEPKSLVDCHEFTPERELTPGRYQRFFNPRFTSFFWSVADITEAVSAVFQMVEYFTEGCKISADQIGVIILEKSHVPHFSELKVEIGPPRQFVSRYKSVMIVMLLPGESEYSGSILVTSLTRVSDALVVIGSTTNLERKSLYYKNLVKFYEAEKALYSGVTLETLTAYAPSADISEVEK